MQTVIMNRILAILFLLPYTSYAQQKEKWIDLPRHQWPAIALTNHVQLRNGDRYVDPSFSYAATGFLIDTGKDTLAAATKHTLWILKQKTNSVLLNNQLQYWVMKPKGNTTDSAIINRLLNEDSTEILQGAASSILERDWLVFSVKNTTGNIHPLKIRQTALQPGEPVYILSCDYQHPASMIFEGNVLKKLGTEIFIERKDPMSHAGGSSGSPVIDANGYLIGILSSSSADGETGKPVSVLISTEYLADVINKKPGLNRPKKDYGQLILQTVLEKGTAAAINQYKQLTSDPRNYYIYSLRSANRNGLRETGQKLIEMNRIKEAVEILEFNVKVNRGYTGDQEILQKAYKLLGK